MKYTREQIEFHVDDRPPSIGDDLYAWASDAEYIIRQLLAENDALREDAERYRWLIKQAWFQQAFDKFDPDDGGTQIRFESECARIIDAARKKG